MLRDAHSARAASQSDCARLQFPTGEPDAWAHHQPVSRSGAAGLPGPGWVAVGCAAGTLCAQPATSIAITNSALAMPHKLPAHRDAGALAAAGDLLARPGAIARFCSATATAGLRAGGGDR